MSHPEIMAGRKTRQPATAPPDADRYPAPIPNWERRRAAAAALMSSRITLIGTSNGDAVQRLRSEVSSARIAEEQ
jgi:hypothetical protein